MRAMLAYANRYNNIFRDDQQIFVRYMLQNPHLVSISRLSATDDDSRDQKIHSEESLFLSLFKEATSDNSSQLTVTLDLKFIYQATSSIGLLHFNNRKSSNMYDVIVESLQIIISTCYSGSDGISLLQAVYAIRDGRYDIALLILTTDVVRNNMKSYGGTNTLGDYLLERVTQLQASVRKQNEQLSERS